MGEYATHNGQSIKIGTCEDMYYLRATQARDVIPESGSCDPSDPAVQRVIRFRFPWPDEDGTPPGFFEPYARAVTIPDLPAPADLAHDTVQFAARESGYLVSLPCPEGGPADHGLRVGRNGFAGAVQITQQAYRCGVLALVCRCGGCGALWSVLPHEIEPYLVALRAAADRTEWHPEVGGRIPDARSTFWHALADRIAAGYGLSTHETVPA